MKTTIAISKNTADKLTELAREKGVAKGVFIENMIEFFLENNIDYSDKNHIKGIVRGEVDRLIKIVRNQEMTYFKPSAEKLTQVCNNMNNAISQAMETDLSAEQLDQLQVAEEKITQLELSYQNVTTRSQTVCQLIDSLNSRSRVRKNMVEIEVEQDVFRSLLKYKDELQRGF